MHRALFALPIAMLAGCTTVSDVTKTGPSTYMVGASVVGGHKSHTETKAMAYKKASEYCEGPGKEMVGGNAESKGARGWTPISAELTFQCVDRPPPK